MKILDLCNSILKLYDSQTMMYEYDIVDLEQMGGGGHFFLKDAPNCIYLQQNNYPETLVKEIKTYAKKGQYFSIFRVRNNYFFFSWEPYVTTFVVNVFQSVDDIKSFLEKNKNKLFQQ